MEQAFEISAPELKAWLDEGRPVTVLDVRNPQEWEICRLDGAKLIPLPELQDRLGELDPAVTIVAHCHHGARSAARGQLPAPDGLLAGDQPRRRHRRLERAGGSVGAAVLTKRTSRTARTLRTSSSHRPCSPCCPCSPWSAGRGTLRGRLSGIVRGCASSLDSPRSFPVPPRSGRRPGDRARRPRAWIPPRPRLRRPKTSTSPPSTGPPSAARRSATRRPPARWS